MRRTCDDALELYQDAVARDPAFARAHAAIASAYVVLPGYTQADDDQEELFKLAESSARQALTLDPNIGEAHAVLAQINAERGDLLDAESGFFFAISLEPNEATPHHWYSLLLARVGRMQEALKQAQKAQTLDPTSAVIASNLAGAYLQLARYDEASRYTQMARDLGLDKDKTSGLDAEIAMHKGQWEQAKELLVAQASLPPEIRPFIGPYVDAVRDPSKRPAAIAEMRKLDPKIAKQTDLIGPVPAARRGRRGLRHAVRGARPRRSLMGDHVGFRACLERRWSQVPGRSALRAPGAAHRHRGLLEAVRLSRFLRGRAGHGRRLQLNVVCG